MKSYSECIVQKNTLYAQASLEIKEIVFDYFNIINKEYEMSFEKYKATTEYIDKINELKKSIEEEYLN